MQENGLIDLWVRKYSPDVRQCLDEGRSALSRSPKQKSSITLSNISGAFYVLVFGLCCGIIAFPSELIFSKLWRTRLYKMKRATEY